LLRGVTQALLTLVDTEGGDVSRRVLRLH